MITSSTSTQYSCFLSHPNSRFPVTLRSSPRFHVVPIFRLSALADPRLHPTKSERYNLWSQVQTRHQPTLIRGSITKDLCLHRWSHVTEMSREFVLTMVDTIAGVYFQTCKTTFMYRMTLRTDWIHYVLI